MFLYLAIALIAGSISVFLALDISKKFSRLITKVDYKILIISVLIFIFIMTFFLSGLLGILILITSTSIGVLAQQLGVGKNNCLGCLILPVILFFVL